MSSFYMLLSRLAKSKPSQILDSILSRYFLWLPDELFIRIKFRLEMGYWPNLNHPKTFSEKLQWLKLYNRRPEYTIMVDKYTVKEYVSSIIGDEYIIPNLGVWNRPEDIEWDKLPEKFVLKTTHSGGNTGVIICKDKAKLDRQSTAAKLKESLKSNIYKQLREWPYKNVKPRIIAEKYIEPQPELQDLPDYKFFCFNGNPKYCQVISGRGSKMCIDFFDADWNHQPFHEPKNYPFANPQPLKPKHFDEMWNLASRLAEGKPFSRIDFYEVGNDVLFGEITFFPTSGMGGFNPSKYDEVLGSMIILKGVNQG